MRPSLMFRAASYRRRGKRRTGCPPRVRTASPRLPWPLERPSQRVAVADEWWRHAACEDHRASCARSKDIGAAKDNLEGALAAPRSASSLAEEAQRRNRHEV